MSKKIDFKKGKLRDVGTIFDFCRIGILALSFIALFVIYVLLFGGKIENNRYATSTISKNKKNLFGYGAYDSDPYNMSYSFDSYEEGIELVARMLVKYYINPPGTPIYDGQTAKASYYSGLTIRAVNTKYASDPNWNIKVYNIMKNLYNKLAP